jgi:hypothetical protein
MENVLNPQLGKCAAVATKVFEPPVHGGFDQDLWGAVVSLVLWAVLWLSSIFAFVTPSIEVRDAGVAAQAIHGSQPVGDPPAACRPGMVVFEGACVLGDEIEVRAPREQSSF